MRIFLDANILFSAADGASATRRLFDAASTYADLITSPHALEEALRNLRQKRPVHNNGLHELQKHVQLTHAFRLDDDFGLPKHDLPILAGAFGAQCSHIWTIDKKHFGKWYGKKMFDTEIISSIQLADLLMKKGWKP